MLIILRPALPAAMATELVVVLPAAVAVPSKKGSL
jgi:hypothetical protein